MTTPKPALALRRAGGGGKRNSLPRTLSILPEPPSRGFFEDEGGGAFWKSEGKGIIQPCPHGGQPPAWVGNSVGNSDEVRTPFFGNVTALVGRVYIGETQ